MTADKSAFKLSIRLNCAAPSGRESPLDTSASAVVGLVERMPKVASAAVAPWDRTDLRDAGSALIAVDCLEAVVAEGLNAAADEMADPMMRVDSFMVSFRIGFGFIAVAGSNPMQTPPYRYHLSSFDLYFSVVLALLLSEKVSEFSTHTCWLIK